MKRMSMVCMMAACLTTQNLSAKAITPMDIYLSMGSEQEIENLREEFKDATKVRKAFEQGLLFYCNSKQIVEFKRKFGLNDEPMLTVVMEIIREKSAKTANFKKDDTANMYWWRALQWLGICADVKAKQFLMDIAVDNANGWDARSYAIEAYMRRAGAQEVLDAVTRFSGDDMRIKGDDGAPPIYLCVYDYATQAYDESEGDTPKREAIATMMSALLAKEESKTIFADVDKNFAKRSKEYAESPQRKAALERMNKPPETLNP